MQGTVHTENHQAEIGFRGVLRRVNKHVGDLNGLRFVRGGSSVAVLPRRKREVCPRVPRVRRGVVQTVRCDSNECQLGQPKNRCQHLELFLFELNCDQ